MHFAALARFLAVASLALACALQPCRAQAADVAAVEAVVRSFHAALAAGDAWAAAAMLAPDAVVLESGERESRQAYLDHHLPEDIRFARAVPSRIGKLEVTLSGDVAWAHATSVAQGSFQSKPVHLLGAELMVLSRSSSGWLIRAIHWSSRKAK